MGTHCLVWWIRRHPAYQTMAAVAATCATVRPPDDTERQERQQDGQGGGEQRVGERQQLRRLGHGGVDR